MKCQERLDDTSRLAGRGGRALPVKIAPTLWGRAYGASLQGLVGGPHHRLDTAPRAASGLVKARWPDNKWGYYAILLQALYQLHATAIALGPAAISAPCVGIKTEPSESSSLLRRSVKSFSKSLSGQDLKSCPLSYQLTFLVTDLLP